MLFHSLQFLLFLPLVLAAYWLLKPSKVMRQWLLVGASFLFYMAWNPAPIVLTHRHRRARPPPAAGWTRIAP